MPDTYALSIELSLEDVDLEYGEVVGRADMPGSDPSTVRLPIEDILGWTARREERRLREYHETHD
ncbi:hypothetical protein [Natronobacterium gregoryi]|uniref:Uncharacterized protein n=2 Tax=Natronobacterium gregoryi TaxID=44930 RepID=L0AMY2_NATGS|nr:hypothetical protein [Natronobacterium gregoryi]AFZ74562.1 hypothetical protein Natgr_3443 [Natronobacterium gregoryi SP2]ELY72368.1 hypothetical protein C490_03453 [Natronobacterium gregoryi SP2]PLK21696.1 hypothetical protein CYV19_02345 [Natronobacterium gregoryi SP2]SFI96174.1 hypothetical protein SAMN05443661_110143 [Natronobacterium gregoryi]